MEIEKLIEQLNDWNENLISELCADDKLTCDDLCDGKDCIVVRAATALSTLQSENEKLRAELEQVRRCIEIVEHQRDEAIYDMTALMAGQCCDLCAVEYCNDRVKRKCVLHSSDPARRRADMERLTDKKEADVQRRKYEIRIKQGYPRNIPEERFLRLAPTRTRRYLLLPLLWMERANRGSRR